MPCFPIAELPSLPAVSTWTPQDIATFLEAIELPEYKPAFAAKNTTGKELIDLREPDLATMGIEKLGHRKARLVAFPCCVVEQACALPYAWC